MSKAYQFPNDPNQPNPFAEPTEPPRAETDNPYAAPIAPAGIISTGDAGHYQATLPHRGGVLLLLGLLGVVSGLATLPFAYFCLPVGVLLLALSIPVWSMARDDLRAMQAGAMDATGRTNTRIAWALSLLTTLLAVASGAFSLFLLIWFWNE